MTSTAPIERKPRSEPAPPLPRVLYAAAMDPSDKFGSMEEQMAILAAEFQEQRSLFLPLFTVTGPLPQSTPLERAGAPIACLDMRHFRWSVLRQLLTLVRLRRIEVVHWNFHDEIQNSYLWWLTILCPRVRHYFTDHRSRSFPLPTAARGWKRSVKRRLLKRYAQVIGVSQFVCDCQATEDVWSNTVCCHHFINTDRFQPNAETRAKIRKQYNAADQFVVLAVAQLIQEKGIDVAIRALTELPESVVLWIIGTGPKAAELMQLSQDVGLAKRVVFHGSQKHVEPFMQGADCLVCPSRWAEAAGLVNLEAQASGLPVIASDVGGISEYVADGDTGLLFPAGDASALALCLQRFINSPQLHRQMAVAARLRVDQQFSVAAQMGKMLAIYRA